MQKVQTYFRNRRSENIVTYSETGSPEYNTYIETIDNRGQKTLEISGKTNLYNKIQEALPTTLIYNILDRYYQGDIEALGIDHGQFMDITEAPTSLIEAYQKISQIEGLYDKLPLELREASNFSPTEFMAMIENGELTEQIKNTFAEKNIEPEVIPNGDDKEQ